MRVELSSTEVQIARYIGKLRDQLLNHQPHTRDFTGKLKNNDIEASAGELAVAKVLNVYPEWSPAPKAPKFDLQLNGQHIDVKTTQHEKGNLLIPNLNEDNIYVLVRGSMPNFEVVGYIPGTLVAKIGEKTDQVYQPCYTIYWQQLFPIAQIKTLL